MDQEPTNFNDSVDDLVNGWGRAMAGIDPSPLHALSRISRIAQRLDAARRQSFAAFNLQTWEFDVLSALRRATPPHELTPGELIDETLVTSGTMTNRITRMTDRGLVTRHASERDGRVVNIRLTATGQTAVESAFMSLLSQEQNLLEGLSGQDKDVLAEILRRLLRRFEEQ
ncbi:MarR family winged helix-turn-helix transcriptional regulator [Arthrobacter monumenti]